MVVADADVNIGCIKKPADDEVLNAKNAIIDGVITADTDAAIVSKIDPERSCPDRKNIELIGQLAVEKQGDAAAVKPGARRQRGA